MDGILESHVDCSTLHAINLRQPMVPQVYAAMRAQIIGMEWKPGQLISKADVATNLGVSQSPVREALLKLEEEGLVNVVPRSRTAVSLIDIRHAKEAQFLRIGTEVEVVRTIVDKVEIGVELDALLKHQELFAAHNAISDFSNSDDEFHLTLYRLAGVGGLWTLVNARRAHISRLRHLDLPSQGKMESVLRQHTEIVEALRQGHGEKAEQTLRAHLSGTLSNVDRLKNSHPEYFGEHELF